MNAKKRIAIFASGSGSNFEAIVRAAKDGKIPGCEIVLCVCDQRGAYVIERAEKHHIPVLVTHPRDFGGSKADFEAAIADVLDAERIDLVCLAGYMRICGPTLLGRYEGRIINIHPALLPSFPGAHGIRDAFEYGVKVFGVTVHYVNAEVDGGRIIDQEGFHYDGGDIAELESMIHAVEHRLYPQTIKKIISKI